ncbi:hypothetical protein MBVG596_0209 [Mycoplasmopsis bovigenitalium]|uniref:thermonuclease family protein n=1 Tax=Mycoplasmopsis bovigenitalium TaxID=2112 RepID=UPI00090B3390|nr:thermonuclease family protein [Mycoplasmopsis bovigenitalium]BAW18089.1 hypothetical protein MBVG596_0209 [Mycoplasmopsis bovigenitalium]
MKKTKKLILFSLTIGSSLFAQSCVQSQSTEKQKQNDDKNLIPPRNSADLDKKLAELKIKYENKLPYEISQKFEHNKAIEVKIVNVRDGDTFDFVIENFGGSHALRFAGVDTPEKRTKDGRGNWVETTGQQYEYAKRASRFTDFLSNIPQFKYFVIPQRTKGGQNHITDHYGRIVGICYIKYNDKYINLNSELVRLGYARKGYISLSSSSRYYTSNDTYYYQLTSSEEYAKNNKLGIWSEDANFSEIYPRN